MPTKTKAPVAAKSETKEQLIARLIAKASLDFKCCGHGGHKSKK